MNQSVSLTLGSEIVYVIGTVNQESVSWLFQGASRWSAVVPRAQKGTYEIEISAYDEAGNQSNYNLTLLYGLSVKYDWTERDALNAEDLNRIGRNIIAMRDLLNLYGYHIDVSPKTDWLQSGEPTRVDMDLLRGNIDALQDGFEQLSNWLTIVYNDTVDASQVNAWEWDLYAISIWLERMVTAFLYSGEFYGGEI